MFRFSGTEASRVDGSRKSVEQRVPGVWSKWLRLTGDVCHTKMQWKMEREHMPQKCGHC